MSVNKVHKMPHSGGWSWAHEKPSLPAPSLVICLFPFPHRAELYLSAGVWSPFGWLSAGHTMCLEQSDGESRSQTKWYSLSLACSGAWAEVDWAGSFSSKSLPVLPHSVSCVTANWAALCNPAASEPKGFENFGTVLHMAAFYSVRREGLHAVELWTSKCEML